MKNFQKTIYCPEHGHLNFLFKRIPTIKGFRIQVSVLTTSLMPHYFLMEHAGKFWKITKSIQLPKWIQKHEKFLSEIISKEAKLVRA